MPVLILLRHGQSVWNLENRFTGDTDIDLTPAGEHEAEVAGTLLKYLHIDVAYTSMLNRAMHTLKIVLAKIGTNIPITRSTALNERNYGDLQGLNKAEIEKQYGTKQLVLWRRSYDTAPPNGESLKDTYNRVIPYYNEEIAPQLQAGKNVLIVAHGNSLRALMMYLEHISVTDIAGINIATGIPRLYTFSGDMKLLDAHYLANAAPEPATK